MISLKDCSGIEVEINEGSNQVELIELRYFDTVSGWCLDIDYSKIGE